MYLISRRNISIMRDNNAITSHFDFKIFINFLFSYNSYYNLFPCVFIVLK